MPYHPKQKPRTGGSLRQINTCRKVPLQGNILDNDILYYFLSVYSFYDAPFREYKYGPQQSRWICVFISWRAGESWTGVGM